MSQEGYKSQGWRTFPAKTVVLSEMLAQIQRLTRSQFLQDDLPRGKRTRRSQINRLRQRLPRRSTQDDSFLQERSRPPLAASISTEAGERTAPHETEIMDVAAALMFFTALVGFVLQFDR